MITGRGFAEGDHVLALRNQYRLGLLNGMRGVVERIDTIRHEMIVSTDEGVRLPVPFSYAADGFLAHGYATTIHKAQGATVDRCLVLLDDTTTREHAYTALSRGRRGNDMFVVADDRRVDERHAREDSRDPLDDLRRAIRRSAGKRMALDEVGPAPAASSLQQLRCERDEVRARLGDEPRDPSRDCERLTDARQQAQYARDGAEWRLHEARKELRDLGPIGRRTHPTRRRELEQRISSFVAEVARSHQAVAEIDEQLQELAPTVEERRSWERENRPELDRLDILDRRISFTERLEQVASRGRDRGLELGHGIER